MTSRSGLALRPCWVEIDTQAFENNYRLLGRLAGPGTECLAIVKANAYGHGLEICGPAAVRAGARWLGVTSAEEGLAARAVCPDARIVIMGGTFAGQGRSVINGSLTPVVWDTHQLDELERAAARLGSSTLAVHLEIDTGMSRQGVSLDDLPALLTRFTAKSPLRLEAMMTHLYASDDTNRHTTAAQLERLDEALLIVRDRTAVQPEFLSVGASASLLGGETDQTGALAARFNLRPMLRLGLVLYGVTPRFCPPFVSDCEPEALTAATDQLQPVLAWKTQVASLRSVPAGTEVGYNGTFVATEPMRLALLPLGYADGLDRRLSNRFSLLVRGQRAPLVGRISMDQAVLDVTGIEGVTPGDEVVILGAQGNESITTYDHADAAETIPWEVFTRIAQRNARAEI